MSVEDCEPLTALDRSELTEAIVDAVRQYGESLDLYFDRDGRLPWFGATLGDEMQRVELLLKLPAKFRTGPKRWSFVDAQYEIMRRRCVNRTKALAWLKSDAAKQRAGRSVDPVEAVAMIEAARRGTYCTLDPDGGRRVSGEPAPVSAAGQYRTPAPTQPRGAREKPTFVGVGAKELGEMFPISIGCEGGV